MEEEVHKFKATDICLRTKMKEGDPYFKLKGWGDGFAQVHWYRDETWVFHYNPENTRLSMKWQHTRAIADTRCPQVQSGEVHLSWRINNKNKPFLWNSKGALSCWLEKKIRIEVRCMPPPQHSPSLYLLYNCTYQFGWDILTHCSSFLGLTSPFHKDEGGISLSVCFLSNKEVKEICGGNFEVLFQVHKVHWCPWCITLKNNK